MKHPFLVPSTQESPMLDLHHVHVRRLAGPRKTGGISGCSLFEPDYPMATFKGSANVCNDKGNLSSTSCLLTCHYMSLHVTLFLLDSTSWIVEESQRCESLYNERLLVPNRAQSTTSCEARATGHSKNSLPNADSPIESKPT